MIPVAFAAERGNRIVRLDAGHEDAGSDIDFMVETAAVAPAGVSGSCAFDRVRLVVTWSAEVTLTITPVLDGVELDESHVLALDAGSERQTKVYELVLRRVSSRGSTYDVRGTWLALRIEGTVASDGDVIVEPAVLEFDVLTPNQNRP